ncbi:tellurite resistance TerB family protein [Roseomonas sp. KE0001]|uniref:tellurite resistance TerB family protein n=1 Tax=Roseomonas sp. KE0001 TaxID=2479201 RepID=UPI001E3ABA4A|nr:DUF533 domain-containing protein [Roseomonas sp. KE0001]
MIDPKILLEQFLGAGRSGGQANPSNPRAGGGDFGSLIDAARAALGGGGPQAPQGQSAPGQTFPGQGGPPPARGGSGFPGAGFGGGGLGGAAMGGLLGMLLGRGRRGRSGGLLATLGPMVLGALASRAFQAWQQGRAAQSSTPLAPQQLAEVDPRFLPSAAPATDGQPFEFAVIRAMVAAAKADGHLDEQERAQILGQMSEGGMDVEAQQFLAELMASDLSPATVAKAAGSEEQASQLYVASRIVVDAESPQERAYLDALAVALRLPPDLAAHLDHQVTVTLQG